MPVRHALDVHDLLVIGAIVLNDCQVRNAMMCGGPQRMRCHVELAVAGDADNHAPAGVAMRERSPESGNRLIADSIAT